MTTHNPNNERIKRKYFAYLKEAMRHSEATVDGVAKSISRFEVYNKHRDFRIQYSDADFFNLSAKDTRVATARREKKVPTMQQIRHVINSMPFSTEIERRNRALIAFTLLTGARDSAIASAKLKHIDQQTGSFYQDARDVQTKFSKTFTTVFFPVGDEIVEIFTDWVNYLRNELLWGNDDPVFPATRIAVGASRHFEVAGLERKHWSNATPIRAIFKDAFTHAGLPYFNPHSLRNTLVQLGETVCQTPEAFKAWSQNLGHEKVMTTFLSYGEVSFSRQGEIIKSLGAVKEIQSEETAVLLKEILGRLDSVASGR
jgi:integrase